MVITLVVLLGLLLVADRGGAYLAGRVIADRLQASAGLDAPPSVAVTGFPFLTQVARGRYDRLEVEAAGVPAGDLRFATLNATLTGVQVPLADLVRGDVGAVPVDSVQAQVLLSYAELARSSGDRQLTVTPAGDQVRVRGSVRVLGRTLAATAVSSLTVEGDDIVVTAESFEVGNSLADAALTAALRGRLDLRLAVRRLPYGLTIGSVQAQPEGVLVRTSARNTVLDAG